MASRALGNNRGRNSGKGFIGDNFDNNHSGAAAPVGADIVRREFAPIR
jgi:hypothetical protein